MVPATDNALATSHRALHVRLAPRRKSPEIVRLLPSWLDSLTVRELSRNSLSITCDVDARTVRPLVERLIPICAHIRIESELARTPEADVDTS